jgi:hypothetical protein
VSADAEGEPVVGEAGLLHVGQGEVVMAMSMMEIGACGGRSDGDDADDREGGESGSGVTQRYSHESLQGGGYVLMRSVYTVQF